MPGLKSKTQDDDIALFIVSDLITPICGVDCDVADQPSHFVGIKLSEGVKERIKYAMRSLSGDVHACFREDAVKGLMAILEADARSR